MTQRLVILSVAPAYKPELRGGPAILGVLIPVSGQGMVPWTPKRLRISSHETRQIQSDKTILTVPASSAVFFQKLPPFIQGR